MFNGEPPPMDAPTRNVISNQAGVSLMEMIIALALFGLIGMSGLVLLTSVVNVRDRTDGRLERLTEIEDALARIRDDVMQAEGRSILAETSSLSLSWPGADPARSAAGIAYRFEGGTLMRTRDGADDVPLLTGLESVTFAAWPLAAPQDPDARPRAIDVILQLDDDPPGLRSPGGGGRIRLTVETASP
jgi:prepilin-type N-terminal cleavage/methylation domain-containing protein